MRMVDLIAVKRDGLELTSEEIRFIINGYCNGDIPDYQMSALLMAIYYKGMSDSEILELTTAMAESGDMVDLSGIPGVKVDKHSTGGVGDKTTLIVAPIVASMGVKVAKMSGRGLGHTGGTVDKLESIPGLKMDLNRDQFFQVVNKTGLSVIGQSGNLTPADKKMYALRDVTATVDSIPLIASSIMSKKIAAGSDAILLDVKVGRGAFMKNLDDAVKLAETMVSLGENAGRTTRAVVTDMDSPLGNAIGNNLEVIEAVNTLKGKGPEDLTAECIELAGNMLSMAGLGDIEECKAKAIEAINSGKALERLIAMVEAQGGDSSVLIDTDKFEKASVRSEYTAKKQGYITQMDATDCGIASAILGAGRETLESTIDYSAGIVLNKKIGDYVEKGEVIATLYTNKPECISEAKVKLDEALTLGDSKPDGHPLILATITKSTLDN